MLEPDKKYLSIREVSERTDVPSYTLRYWEKEFKQLKPERHSGIRKYSPLDVELIKKIKDLLYKKKFTIEGVKNYLKTDRRKKVQTGMEQSGSSSIDIKVINEIEQDLKDILEILE